MSRRARRWLAAHAEYQRLVADGVVRALPQYDDRNRELYLSDVEAREQHRLSVQDKYDDAKQRFVYYNTLNTVRLPQPESGRAWRQRQDATIDGPWFQGDSNNAHLAGINDRLDAVLALLKEGR